MIKFRKVASVTLAATMMLASLNLKVFADLQSFSALSVTDSGSWAECVYATWQPYSGAESYNVYYKQKTETQYVKADSELIRGTRADLVGLIGGREYDVKIVPVVAGNEVTSAEANLSLTPRYVERVGYAFKDDATWTSGGYNKDGTVPENADIIYVTPENQATVTLERGGETFVGFEKIMRMKQRGDAAYKDDPLIVRFIGQFTHLDKMNDAFYTFRELKNLTLEGVGPETGFTKMGLDVSYSCENVEIRNLSFRDFEDDGIQVATGSSSKVGSRRVFIHHNTFGYGYDGACDVKKGSDFVTIAYNHVDGADKNMLCGHSNNNSAQDIGHLTVTYYQNWFDGSKQRNPRVRFGKVHVLNNYYDGVTLYGIGSACEAHVLVEGNYFYQTARPYCVSDQGNAVAGVSDNVMSSSKAGYLKAVDNYIDPSCTYYGDPLDENLSGYDFEPKNIYNYTAKTPEQAKADCISFAGKIPESSANGDVVTQTTTQTTTQTETTTQITTEVPVETTTVNQDGIKGDVNNDGTLTASDAANVLAFVLNSDSFELNKTIADADSNGEITASDAATVLAKVLNNDFVL